MKSLRFFSNAFFGTLDLTFLNSRLAHWRHIIEMSLSESSMRSPHHSGATVFIAHVYLYWRTRPPHFYYMALLSKSWIPKGKIYSSKECVAEKTKRFYLYNRNPWKIAISMILIPFIYHMFQYFDTECKQQSFTKRTRVNLKFMYQKFPCQINEIPLFNLNFMIFRKNWFLMKTIQYEED